MASLTSRLRWYAVALLLPLQLCVTLASYSYVVRRASHLCDDALRSEAEALAQQGCGNRYADETAGAPRIAASSRRGRTAFECWGSDNRLVSTTPEFAPIALDALPFGFVDRDLDGRRWRIYTALAGATWIRVGSRSLPGSGFFHDGAALLLLAVAAAGVPLVLLAVGAVVSRTLVPVDALAEDIARRSPDDTTPLGPGELPRELEPVVAAVNGLVRKCATRPHLPKAV